MDLVNIIYRYVNRFINSEELLHLMENIEKTNFSKKELVQINQLIDKIKEIIEKVPIKIDKMEKNRIATIEHMIKLFGKNLESEKLDEKSKEIVLKEYNQLLKDKEKIGRAHV